MAISLVVSRSCFDYRSESVAGRPPASLQELRCCELERMIAWKD